MKTKLVRIGNSRGVRLPKAVMERVGLHDEVDITVRDNQVILRPVSVNPREGWDEAFQWAIAARGHAGLDEDWQLTPNDSDRKGWSW